MCLCVQIEPDFSVSWNRKIRCRLHRHATRLTADTLRFVATTVCRAGTDSFAMAEERRKHPRVPVQTVFSYICLDEDGHPIDEGMGTTVDISQGGIMIETSRPIETETLLLVSVNKDKKLVEIRGKVVHSRAIGPSKHLHGIQFKGSPEEVTKMVKSLIIEFHSRKSPIR